MGWINNKKAVMKFSFIILSLLAVSAIIVYTGFVMAATHISTADLQPEWSQLSSTNDYTVEITNTDGDSIDEIRIMRNPEYDNLNCEEKSGWTLIFVPNFYDPEYDENIDICWYFTNDANAIPEGHSEIFEFSASSPEDRPDVCELKWKFETRDIEDYWISIYDTTSVDNLPPNTTKSYIGPVKEGDGFKWIDGVTEIKLEAEDFSVLCGEGIGVDEIRYRVSGALADDFCYSCDTWMDRLRPDMGDWMTYDDPFGIEEESCHIVEYSSVDLLGNEEEVKWQCMFVDKTPPKPKKIVGDPNVLCRDLECEEFDYWLRDDTDLPGTPVTLECTDPEPHPAGDEEVCYQITYDLPVAMTDITDQYCGEGLELVEDKGYEGEWCCVDAPEEIVFIEDSLHSLEYFCRDAVNKKSSKDLEYFRVDSLPPIITKTMIGDDHLGYRDGVLNEDACPPNPLENDVCYVADNGVNGVKVQVADDEAMDCAVDNSWCEWELWWMDEKIDSGKFVEEEFAEIIFTKDSTHTLIVTCEDALGNKIVDEEEFKVDSTPPETRKWFVGDQYPMDDDQAMLHYIDLDTLVNLEAKDEKVGVDEIRYRVSGALADRYCNECEGWMQAFRPDMGDWITYIDPFTIAEESCHVIEYSSIDLLNNEERIKWQCVFVDDTPPITEKEIGDPKVIECIDEPEEPGCYGDPVTDACNAYNQGQCGSITGCDWIVDQVEDVCIGTATNEACNAYDGVQCGLITGCSWFPGTDCAGYSGDQGICESFPGCSWDNDACIGSFGATCTGTPSLSCLDIQAIGEANGYPDKCTETAGCEWETPVGGGSCVGTPDSCEAAAAGWPGDPEGKCLETTGCDWGIEPDAPAQMRYGIGDVVHELDASDLPVPGAPNHCSIGLTFDGNSLYYNICDDLNIYEIDPITGDLRNTFNTDLPSSHPNAMAYDTKRDGIWFGTQDCDDGEMPIYFWDFSDDSVNLMFHVQNGDLLSYCFTDGLAYNENDPSTDADDEIWFSDDVHDLIGVFRPDGTPVDTYDPTTIDSSLSRTSGIAVGGPNLYLGNNGGGEVFRADIDTWTPLGEFASTSDRVEDMTCDPITFAPTEVMWVRHTPQSNPDDDVITAHAIEPGTCGVGGEEPTCENYIAYINQQTPITLTCVDPEPHPSDHVSMFYRYRFAEDCDDLDLADWSEWMEPLGDIEEKTIFFTEDSCHELEYYCVDILGNEEEHQFEIDIVDTQAPEIVKEIIGPMEGDCPPRPDSDVVCFFNFFFNLVA